MTDEELGLTIASPAVFRVECECDHEWYVVSPSHRLGPYINEDMAARVAKHWTDMRHRRLGQPIFGSLV